MMPAAKMFDPILGVDVHMIQPPGPVPPVPIPHPHTGVLFDPFDLAPYIGSTISVGGIPRAVAGSGTQLAPDHIPIGGTFIKPPANDSELLLGSSTVIADGDPFSYLGLPLLSCWDVGMPPIPRPPRSLLPSLVLPTTVVLAVPSGVTVGGSPTVSLSALAGRVGLGPLLALYNFAKTGNPLALIGLAGPALKGLKFLNKKLKFIKKSKCGKGVKLFNGKLGIGGDPIDLISGAQLLSADDFVEPGGLFRLERHYSTARRDELGVLGHGFTHGYEHALELFPQSWRYRDPEDGQIDFDPLGPQRPESREGGMVLRLDGSAHVELLRRGKPRLRFALPAERRPRARPAGGGARRPTRARAAPPGRPPGRDRPALPRGRRRARHRVRAPVRRARTLGRAVAERGRAARARVRLPVRRLPRAPHRLHRRRGPALPLRVRRPALHDRAGRPQRLSLHLGLRRPGALRGDDGAGRPARVSPGVRAGPAPDPPVARGAALDVPLRRQRAHRRAGGARRRRADPRDRRRGQRGPRGRRRRPGLSLALRRGRGPLGSRGRLRQRLPARARRPLPPQPHRPHVAPDPHRAGARVGSAPGRCLGREPGAGCTGSRARRGPPRRRRSP